MELLIHAITSVATEVQQMDKKLCPTENRA